MEDRNQVSYSQHVLCSFSEQQHHAIKDFLNYLNDNLEKQKNEQNIWGQVSRTVQSQIDRNYRESITLDANGNYKASKPKPKKDWPSYKVILEFSTKQDHCIRQPTKRNDLWGILKTVYKNEYNGFMNQTSQSPQRQPSGENINLPPIAPIFSFASFNPQTQISPCFTMSADPQVSRQLGSINSNPQNSTHQQNLYPLSLQPVVLPTSDSAEVECFQPTNLVSSTMKNNTQKYITIHFDRGIMGIGKIQEVCKADNKEFAKDEFCHDGKYRGATQKRITDLVDDTLDTFYAFNSQLELINFTFKNISSLGQLDLLKGYINCITFILDNAKNLKKNINVDLIYGKENIPNKRYDLLLQDSQNIITQWQERQSTYKPMDMDWKNAKAKTEFDTVYSSYEEKKEQRKEKRREKIKKITNEREEIALQFMRDEHLFENSDSSDSIE